MYIKSLLRALYMQLREWERSTQRQSKFYSRRWRHEVYLKEENRLYMIENTN